MTESTSVIEGWAILELMGHRRLGGFLSEVSVAGAAMVRIDVPHPQKLGETARQAAFDAAALRRKQRRSDIDVYQCPHCGGIHVGHTPRIVALSPAPGSKRGW